MQHTLSENTTVEQERLKASLDLSYLVGAMDVYVQQLRALLEISHDSDGSDAQYGTSEEWSQYAWMSSHVPCAAFASLEQHALQKDDHTPMGQFFRKNMVRLTETMNFLKALEDKCNNDIDTVHRALHVVDATLSRIEEWRSCIAYDIDMNSQSLCMPLMTYYYHHHDTDDHYKACEHADYYRSFQNVDGFDPQQEVVSLEALHKSGNIDEIMRSARGLYMKVSLRVATSPQTWGKGEHDRATDALLEVQSDATDADYMERLQKMSSRFEYVHPSVFPIYAVEPSALSLRS